MLASEQLRALCGSLVQSGVAGRDRCGELWKELHLPESLVSQEEACFSRMLSAPAGYRQWDKQEGKMESEVVHTRLELVTFCVLSRRDNQLHQRTCACGVRQVEYVKYIHLNKGSHMGSRLECWDWPARKKHRNRRELRSCLPDNTRIIALACRSTFKSS